MAGEVQQPKGRWRAVGAVTVVALSFGLGSPAGASNPTFTIDQHRSQYTLGDAVSAVHDACVPQPDADLTVTVRQPRYEFSTEIVCSAALSDTERFIKEPLVKEASHHQDAGKRANAVGDAFEALPTVSGVGYDHDETVWAIAAHDPARCGKAETQKSIRDNMSASIRAQDPGESPAHWTLVEALWAMASCPGRLPALYENVAALGNPIAAQTVKDIMGRRPVTLPLESVPQGVSARTVGGRSIYLERDGTHVTTFLTDVHHLPGERALWYCPQQHVFASPLHGETFNEAGAIVGGPAERGLDRFRTAVRNGTVTVHLSDIIRGSGTRADTSASAAQAASPSEWNTDPKSFCFLAVKNSVTPFG